MPPERMKLDGWWEEADSPVRHTGRRQIAAQTEQLPDDSRPDEEVLHRLMRQAGLGEDLEELMEASRHVTGGIVAWSSHLLRGGHSFSVAELLQGAWLQGLMFGAMLKDELALASECTCEPAVGEDAYRVEREIRRDCPIHGERAGEPDGHAPEP